MTLQINEKSWVSTIHYQLIDGKIEMPPILKNKKFHDSIKEKFSFKEVICEDSKDDESATVRFNLGKFACDDVCDEIIQMMIGEAQIALRLRAESKVGKLVLNDFSELLKKEIRNPEIFDSENIKIEYHTYCNVITDFLIEPLLNPKFAEALKFLGNLKGSDLKVDVQPYKISSAIWTSPCKLPDNLGSDVREIADWIEENTSRNDIYLSYSSEESRKKKELDIIGYYSSEEIKQFLNKLNESFGK